MEKTHPPLVRTRLSIMMFLEFFVWGGWGFALTGYASSLGFEGWQIGWLAGIPAIGAIVSPLLVGPIADRFFSAQRVLSVLHVVGGGCLIFAGFQTSFMLLMIAMMLNGLFFMPSIALANSVAFSHIPNPEKFPRIAVLGTIGWIVAVLSASVLFGGAGKPNFLFQSGIGSIVLGLYCLTLPNTPPKGAGGGDAFGLSALKLLKNPSILLFIVCVFLVSIPACGYFFSLAVPMMMQRGYPSPLALTTLNQFSEIVFMFSMPWFVSKLGLKRVLMIGMAAWGVRYLCFASPAFSMALIGLLLHGFCYSFLYVASYMYIDKRAPEDLKASAQSFLTFLLIGIGYLAGANLSGKMMDTYPAPVPTMAAALGTDSKAETRALPKWDDPDAATSAWRYLDLSATIKSMLTGEARQAADPDLGSTLDTNKDGKITMDEVKAISDAGLQLGGATYTRDEMVQVFKKIASVTGEESTEDSISLTRQQWLEAQSCNWWPIWIYPAIAVFIVLAVFGLGFRDVPSDEANSPKEEPAEPAPAE